MTLRRAVFITGIVVLCAWTLLPIYLIALGAVGGRTVVNSWPKPFLPPAALRENSAFSVKYERFRSSRSVFVQASTSARKPILVESRTMRSAASGGVSKARTSKIAPT
jgi:hypothetical protein